MNRFFISFAMLALLSFFTEVRAAHAADLGSLKAEGVLGEQTDGYLGLVKADASPEAKGVMNSINAERKAHYQEIAKKNGTPLSAVEALAGKKAIEKTPSGQYVFVPGAGWKKK